MQVLYAYLKSSEGSLTKYERELFHSIDKSFELYHMFFLVPIELVAYANQRIELAKNKRIPTEEDLNPNLKFVKNKVVEQLLINRQLSRFINETGISWTNHPEIIKGLYTSLTESEFYQEYMANKNDYSYAEDKRFVENIFAITLTNFEKIYQTLEEQSIYWNDEIEFVISMNIKTLRNFKSQHTDDAPLMPLFKNEEDRDFTKKLFRKVVLNHKENENIIDVFTTNWELERIAFMDRLLMEMAISELLEFPSIPVKVTLNEYIDLAKMYSTKKSNVFINGILDKIIQQYKKEKKIVKTGRGLIGEVSTNSPNN